MDFYSYCEKLYIYIHKCYLMFAKLNLMQHKALGDGHLVKIKLITLAMIDLANLQTISPLYGAHLKC